MIKKEIFKWRLRLQLKARHLKKIYFGHPDKNLYDVIRIFIQQLKKDDIGERAGSMAFSYTIALFPLLLFLLNLVPYLQDFFPVVTTENILDFVQNIIPADLYQNIETTLMDIVSKPRQSLLSFGFFFALFASTQGVMSMMTSFNSVYKTKENRGYLMSRLIAFSIVFALVLTVITASSVMIVGSILINALDEMHLFNSNFMIFLFNTLKFLILLFVFYITSAFIFRFAPAVHDKWHFFSTGAHLSGLLITLAFYGFIFYLENFASYNKLYGSIGTLLALMLWLWITSLIILVCFEVNVSLDLAEDKQKERERRRKVLGRPAEV
ncbi:YihY/virulence factor BrkB family protein [Algoriphagus sp. H41]|uniref:YihY/virulence factor BrkB family protein n=1 Tax=Algoriphagus oliviformis TaxID=2811231 RepID=A0ABS3C300_9BACT|nr:YihY/virulence factor BrkB family protein [Algoriphagus oliviformis]MBN7811498.1 YihY/virulence factor BrkB family protein [Algoriphagus oliviformis]